MKYMSLRMMGDREELQRKAPNWLAQGPGVLSEGILFYTTKRFLCFFPPTLDVFCNLSLKHHKTFHIAHFHIFISMLTFISNSDFLVEGETISVTVWHWLCSELWVAPSGLKGNLFLFCRFLKHISQGTLRDMLAFTGNNMMENNLLVNCMTGIKGHS